jgi:hypothetical protein
MHRFISRPVRPLTRCFNASAVFSSPNSAGSNATTHPSADAAKPAEAETKRVLSLAERDAAMMAALEEHSGDGGAAGLELEDGKAPAMKRGGV